ncbi:Membrane protein involved in the export of O-antigen and teichoic acid [Actinokineospora iranica]|uniref:Membrane protein involved in the export of O-antigen and teichoic acid n=2 Tax=Actinokineospora iranica TaxID=1271860 RepID=A0A1G6P4M3_9PSEU|nr:Membrane protein involved in the export of O-antigen and teichoic acid [Actinokineospora iranica]
MGAGLVVVGLAGYGFLALSGQTLSAADNAAVLSFYLIMSIVGPGVFTGVEQETSRSTSAWLASGGSLRTVAGRASLVAAGLVGVVLVVLAAASPVLTDKVLDGQWGLFFALGLGVAGSAAVYVVRGLLGGTQRFNGYAVSLTVEGLSRIVLCAVVVVLGLTNATLYAFIFALGAVFSLLAGLPWLRHRDAAAVEVAAVDGLPTDAGNPVTAMARGMTLLVGATLGFQAVANLAPILVNARLEYDKEIAEAFGSAFVLVRIPVLLFAAVQAMLMPVLTKAVTTGDLPAFRATLRKILLLLAAIGVPAVLGATILGPWAVEVLFGAEVRLPHAILGLLAASTILLMLTQVLLPALVALSKHRIVTVAWVIGGVVLIGLLSLPIDPVWTAVWAQLVACGLVTAVMAASLVGPLRQTAATKAQEPEPAR